MIKKILSVVMVFVLMLALSASVLAQGSGGAAKIVVEAPQTAKVGEAIDVTVKILDKDNNVANDYRGQVFFITNYIGDIVPATSRPIEFKPEHQGVMKFSKGVTFKRAGKNKITVADIDNPAILGEVTVSVDEAGAVNIQNNEELAIITPANEAKIPGNNLTISGKARKNSKISLSLNGTDIGTVVSDDSGLFTKEISNLTQDDNILKASLIDADGKAVATSPEIKFSKSKEANSIYGVTISPNTTVEASSEITLNIEAVKGLTDVLVTLDGTALSAKEISEWKYSLTTTAPAKVGSYPLDVTAKTATAQSVSSKAAATLTVTEKTVSAPPKEEVPAELSASFKNIKTETKDTTVNFSFGVENPPKDLSAFKITYGSTGSVTTHSADKILSDNIYKWYISNLNPGDYTFKIEGINGSGSVISGLTSEPIMATIGVQACVISNVGKISIETNNSKSVLTWPAVEWATGYNVYRVENGKYTLVQNVKEPTYSVFLSKWAVQYGDFAVKATCGDGTESGDYSQASRVQTGPGFIAFAVIIAAIGAAVILRRRA